MHLLVYYDTGQRYTYIVGFCPLILGTKSNEMEYSKLDTSNLNSGEDRKMVVAVGGGANSHFQGTCE